MLMSLALACLALCAVVLALLVINLMSQGLRQRGPWWHQVTGAFALLLTGLLLKATYEDIFGDEDVSLTAVNLAGLLGAGMAAVVVTTQAEWKTRWLTATLCLGLSTVFAAKAIFELRDLQSTTLNEVMRLPAAVLLVGICLAALLAAQPDDDFN